MVADATFAIVFRERSGMNYRKAFGDQDHMTAPSHCKYDIDTWFGMFDLATHGLPHLAALL
jgi:hypothetical protein